MKELSSAVRRERTQLNDTFNQGRVESQTTQLIEMIELSLHHEDAPTMLHFADSQLHCLNVTPSKPLFQTLSRSYHGSTQVCRF
jgi:hypothetical protein